MIGCPQVSVLPGQRLHLHHGPIDLVIGVAEPDRQVCFAAAAARFETVLTGLVAELSELRRPVAPLSRFADPIARRMMAAVRPYRQKFVTPMASVAGAVADEVLAAMTAMRRPTKAYVNNGGDISLHLAGDARFTTLGPAGEITLQAADSARGIATSGWQGRSHSFGIADAVTVLAKSAAAADVAATLIANAVDLPGHPAVTRAPASDLSPDSDLEDRLVTTDVGQLAPSDIHRALRAGCAAADRLIKQGLIETAVLSLQGHIETVDAKHSIGAATNA